jgi:hypothetical protein
MKDANLLKSSWLLRIELLKMLQRLAVMTKIQKTISVYISQVDIGKPVLVYTFPVLIQTCSQNLFFFRKKKTTPSYMLMDLLIEILWCPHLFELRLIVTHNLVVLRYIHKTRGVSIRALSFDDRQCAAQVCIKQSYRYLKCLSISIHT